MPNPTGRNGIRLRAPDDAIIRPLVEKYVAAGYKNPKIVAKLKDHYNIEHFNVSLSLLKKKRMQWKVKSARGQDHTVHSIGPAIERKFKDDAAADSNKVTSGQRELTKSEPFSGQVLWLKIWWTNWNPRLICGWYCDTVERLGEMPLLTQSDPGSENNGIANGQTLLRHLHDPALARTLQHTFKGSHRNIKPEIFWSQLRRRWAPGFEHLLNIGLDEGFYNPDDPLQRLCFHFIFIPWLQSELDLFTDRFNHTTPRHNINKILPHGRPTNIFTNPEGFESCNFAVKIQGNYLEQVQETYAPPDHGVFNLVPPEFAIYAEEFMSSIGDPTVTNNNVWEIYNNLLEHLSTLLDNGDLQSIIAGQPALPEEGFLGSDFMPVVDMPQYRHMQTNGSQGDKDREEEVVLSSDDDESEFEFIWTSSESGSGSA
ncbi:hypothetical protein SERLADRAFT_435108 [Serpula lacrymans var. lacrymans S7.9]|uniref:Integrase core domain-containing protein n=1 Tax=Serpula lacrymans var. lacrymans (strain S7.9) TaxID=578457 RepID=F8NM81_SERL9|nr:uncharacterized protein SERLADRAFT_435108 [Serpula lacrymans var. lacrymans S7.9]EGO27331.1 hypothetical protein SERLADRAFT_435108 [Serpula lacrymans var. lacrymans S7.9]